MKRSSARSTTPIVRTRSPNLARKYGRPAAFGLLAAIVLFGGYLLWDLQREGALETQSEELVKALDAVEAGNYDTAAPALDKLLADAATTVRAPRLVCSRPASRCAESRGGRRAALRPGAYG